MARKNFKDLRAGLAETVGEDLLADAEQAERDRYELEELALGDVRRARALTQAQLAKALGVSQAQVSRIESQTDLYLSTLASYVEAMGGDLDLIATFPDGKTVELSIGDLRPDEHPPPGGNAPDFAAIVGEELGVPPEAYRTHATETVIPKSPVVGKGDPKNVKSPSGRSKS